VQHTGGMPGVSTCVQFVPSERLAVVVLSNSRSPLAYRLPEMITDILLPERAADEKREPQVEKEPEKKEEEKKPDGDSDGNSSGFAPSAELVGTWNGELVTYQAKTPLRLVIQSDGDVHVRLGQQLQTLLNNVSYRDGYLRGRFAGKVPYDDHRGRDYHVQLELKLRDNKLDGSAQTHTLPDAWGTNAVTHWAELKK
jgi:hypothetical protein